MNTCNCCPGLALVQPELSLSLSPSPPGASCMLLQGLIQDCLKGGEISYSSIMPVFTVCMNCLHSSCAIYLEVVLRLNLFIHAPEVYGFL